MGDEILGGGRAFFAARRPCLQIVSQPPSPPPPSQREGGDHKLVLPGATAPGTPALNRLRRLQSQRNRHSGGRRIPETALTVSAHPVEFFPGSRHEPRLLQSYIREKFWGVWGTLSRVPRRFSLAVAPPIIHSRKVLGGLGDSFKSPPALLLPPCGESGGRRRSPCGAEKAGGYRDQEKRRPRGWRSRQNACGQTACRGTAPVS
mgnify:CR=1 FL=1